MLKIAKMLGYSLGAHGLLVGAILAFLALPRPFPATREIAIAVEVLTPAEVPQARKSEQQNVSPAAEPKSASQTPPPVQQTSAEPQTSQQTAQPQPAAQRQMAPQSNAPEAPPARDNRFDLAASLPYFNMKVPTTSFDAKASEQADLTGEQIAAFKARLKTCWRPGPEVGTASRTHIVLRISLRPDGSVAAQPELVEASAAADGPAIMQAAIGAVMQCAPFAFLPRERYQEWKVMDVRFVPRDMGS